MKLIFFLNTHIKVYDIQNITIKREGLHQN